MKFFHFPIDFLFAGCYNALYLTNRRLDVTMDTKTDLRIVKTRKVIREAFLELRVTSPLEKVKVRDICTLALVNKSTFYNHYEDIFALSEELENEVLSECFDNFELKNSLFDNPNGFLSGIQKAMDAHTDVLFVLFKGRTETLYMKLEKQLLDYYQKPKMAAREDILLTFVIGGVMRSKEVHKAKGKYSDSVLEENIAEFIKLLSSEK